jgi:four helix bundle protein
MVQSYKDLLVWKKSIELAKVIYRLTVKLPKDEQYGLISQMRRSVTSIPCNVAEGSRRSSRKDFRNFILIAYGSGAELETQLELVKVLGLISEENTMASEKILDEVMRMLNSFAKSLL